MTLQRFQALIEILQLWKIELEWILHIYINYDLLFSHIYIQYTKKKNSKGLSSGKQTDIKSKFQCIHDSGIELF